MSAVGFTSMSVLLGLPPALPRPTMLIKASTRVCDRSITMSFMCSKLRHPDPPGSTIVDTARKAEAVGKHHAVVGAESLADRGPVDVRVEIDRAEA